MQYCFYFPESNFRKQGGVELPEHNQENVCSRLYTPKSVLPQHECHIEMKYFENEYQVSSSLSIWDTSINVDQPSDWLQSNNNNNYNNNNNNTPLEHNQDTQPNQLSGIEINENTNKKTKPFKTSVRFHTTSTNIEGPSNRLPHPKPSQRAPLKSKKFNRITPQQERLRAPRTGKENISTNTSSNSVNTNTNANANLVKQPVKTAIMKRKADKKRKSIPRPPLKRNTAVPKPVDPSSNEVEEKVCISCGIRESPCWRPSWSIAAGQLCNSCGLRFRKSRIRCANDDCLFVPSKLEIASLRERAKDGKPFACIKCATNFVNC